MVAILAVVIVTVIQENRDVEGSLSRIPLAYLSKSLVRLKDLLWFSGKENRLSKNQISSSSLAFVLTSWEHLMYQPSVLYISPPITKTHIIYLDFIAASIKTQTGNVFSVGLFNPVVYFMGGQLQEISRYSRD